MKNGRLLLVTRSEVERTAPRIVSPKGRGWLCKVGEQKVSVKVLLVAAANAIACDLPELTAKDFQTAHAVRILRGLGFDVDRPHAKTEPVSVAKRGSGLKVRQL